MPSTIAERIVAAREALGLTQAELARRLGVKQPTLSDMESGETKRPRADTLMAMRAAGINPDYIMNNKRPMLLAEFERNAREEAVLGAFRAISEQQRKLIEALLHSLRRESGQPGPDDPFLEDPPEK